MLKGAFLAALVWQAPLVVNLGAPAVSEHLRFQRAITLPSHAEGLACVVLNAAVLAHTASPAHDDLRVYRSDQVIPTAQSDLRHRGDLEPNEQVEVPYVLTESGPEPVDAVHVAAEHITHRGRELAFDLHMPPRPYSELQLQINAQNFLGTVVVSGGSGHGRFGTLGSFPIFDLSNFGNPGSPGLGRWTTLLLAETDVPVLHLALTLRTFNGQTLRNLPLSLVTGVFVPPSRERQTVYTPVATTTTFRQSGRSTLATLHVPAHVPIEELGVTLKPGSHPNFARAVTLSARSDNDPFNEPETLQAGVLEDIRLPSGDPRLNPIDVEENSLPATLGATLASSATVQFAVANGDGPPLPLAAITLAMRERRLCFSARSEASYTLRYGDAALPAPFYAEPPRLTGPALPAQLGPEQRNPQWTPRRDERSFLERHPEIFWLLTLVCIGMMGGTAMQFVQSGKGGVRR